MSKGHARFKTSGAMARRTGSLDAIIHACTDLLERAVRDAVGAAAATSEASRAAIRDCEQQIAFVLTQDHRIAGGSEPGLLQSLRTRLAEGQLARLPDGKTWAGPATGKTCLICAGTIESPDLEYEVVVGTVSVYVHFVCHKLWLDESRRQHQ